MTSSWLAFTPRDSVFVRDGRSFDAAADSSARPVRPGPSTIAGAVGAALPAKPAEVRGPVLARQASAGWTPHFPMPADLVCTPGGSRRYVFRLVPAEAGGITDLDAGSAEEGGQAPERWLVPPDGAEDAEPAEGLLPADALAAYLAGDLAPAGGVPLDEVRPEPDPLVEERRVGLARDGERRSRPGYLYQSAHWRPDMAGRFSPNANLLPGWSRSRPPVPFGGRGRLADVAPAEAAWPQFPDGVAGQKITVYLATPALWPGGWRLPVPPGARLVAAAVGRPQVAATVSPGPQWARSRVMRWAAPAGSVYLLEFGDKEQGGRWARSVHRTAYGPAVTEELRTAGFGVVLTGAWS